MSTSNIDQVIAYLEQFANTFDFTRKGIDQSLGRDVKKLAAQTMRDRSLQDRTGFGTAWPPNSDTPSHWTEGPAGEDWGYRQWKEYHYGTDQPNSRTGQMLSQLSMEGRSTIEPRQVTMIYGTNTAPTGCAFGSPDPKLFERDRKVTDVEKAYFAHTGQGPHNTVRPFYQLIDDDAVKIAELCQENLNEMINDENRANGY
jgi:hypothetical protein